MEAYIRILLAKIVTGLMSCGALLSLKMVIQCSTTTQNKFLAVVLIMFTSLRTVKIVTGNLTILGTFIVR